MCVGVCVWGVCRECVCLGSVRVWGVCVGSVCGSMYGSMCVGSVCKCVCMCVCVMTVGLSVVPRR